ncbi:MAG: ComF family protein [Verrucomicrobiales bacterium]
MAISWWRGLRSAAVDLVYPPHCPGCGCSAHVPDLCPTCLTQLWACEKPCCQKCGEAYLPEGAGTFVCQTCQGRDFFFDYAVSPYQSRGVLRELIHRFKYQRQLFLGPLLGGLLVDVLQDERIVDLRQDWVAVPVPLHARRYREREFNQALELCRELQERSGIPYVNALKRTRYTSSQTRYRREQRMENLRGAFVPRRWKVGHVAGRTVALVDDVFTTGSTANECARVLLASGAKKVVVITLARG